jgi:hypothetical protein
MKSLAQVLVTAFVAVSGRKLQFVVLRRHSWVHVANVIAELLSHDPRYVKVRLLYHGLELDLHTRIKDYDIWSEVMVEAVLEQRYWGRILH